MMNFRKPILCLASLFLSLSALNIYALPLGPFPPERIDNQIPANNGFTVDQDYWIEFSNNTLKVHSEIQFVLGADVMQQDVNALKPVWEKGIEDTWNNKFYILKDGQFRFPIIIDVTYDGPTFNHIVTVRKGPGVSNEHLWDTLDTGLVAAHEFGHMLGIFDEYTGGATDPAGEIIDSTSIMGSTAIGAKAYARHYEGFRNWLATKDPTEEFKVVPEPESSLLFATGIFVLGVQRLCRRKKIVWQEEAFL